VLASVDLLAASYPPIKVQEVKPSPDAVEFQQDLAASFKVAT